MAGEDAQREEQEESKPLFHIRGIGDSSADQRETDGRTDRYQAEQKNKDPISAASDLCEGSYELVAPPSPKTPTEEQPFVNPMERLRKRTEAGIKESGSLAANSSALTATSQGFYGFPHRRSVVHVDGKKMSENKYCRLVYGRVWLSSTHLYKRVCPSVRLSVRPLPLRKNRRTTHLVARPGLFNLL